MKVQVEFPAGFEEGGPLHIPLGRLYLGQHVVRLTFAPDGRMVMCIPDAAVADGSAVIFKEPAVLGFGGVA